jgi:hypothetical protein
MNKSQLEAQRKQLNAEAAEIERLTQVAMATKS